MNTMTSTQNHFVVVGAGLAGLVAANHAREMGMSVTILERFTELQHLCASRVNGGVFHVGFRSVSADHDELFKVIRRANDDFGDPQLAHALSKNAMRCIQWLQSRGTAFTAMTPDQGWKDYVLAPMGFHDKTHMTWQGLGADRLIASLEEQSRTKGVRWIRGARVQRLIQHDGCVSGVEFLQDGTLHVLNAQMVLLADGGFEGNPQLIREYITRHPENMLIRGCESGLGDGMLMAQSIGAHLIGMDSFYGHILSADSLQREGLSPFPFLEFLAATGMLIDQSGERFVDETLGGHITSNVLARHGNGIGYVVFDEAMWQGIGKHFFCPPNPNLVEAGGTLLQAQTLGELAQKIGIPALVLESHAKQINQDILAKTNDKTADLNRDEMTVYARGKYQHQMFQTAPYYAAPACAALTSTLGGVEIDAHARVLHTDGHVIQGLYASGSVTGGVEGGPSVGYIGGLIKALVFGMLAAEHAAGSTTR
jgi:fumarate reductase flavoprotein subunit